MPELVSGRWKTNGSTGGGTIARRAVRSVTMADVGAVAGVTARTVSNVLGDRPNVSARTRDRVLAAARDLGYQMNVSARGLKTGLTGLITLAIPDLGIDYFAELAQDVMREAEPHGWTVILQQTGGRRENEVKVLSGASRQLSDGLLFHPHALGSGDERYLTSDQPLVLLGERIFDGPVDHVTMPNREAARAATRYLIDRGRRRIAVIGPNPAGGPVSTAGLREAGYLDALRDAGMPVDPRLSAVATTWHHADGEMAMHRLLELQDPPDAVFCFNDALAVGALHELYTRGISVPEQISVVGFDNVSVTAHTNPGLTTIDPGRSQIVKAAVELLARRVADGPAAAPTRIVSDYSLVARRSA